MYMRRSGYVAVSALCLFLCTAVSAQVDRRDVRAGNRQYRKGEYKEADIDFRKALVKDSTSVPANYNLASTLFRQNNYEEAGKMMEKIKDSAPLTAKASDYHYNDGDIALARKDYAGAVEAFRKSLLINPDDLDAKENYIYARKMLENQKNNGGGGQNNENNDRQNQDQNGGGNNGQDRQNQDQNQDRDQNNQQQNQGQDSQQNSGNGQEQQVKISPQQAQQMLKAIQAKEKQTQDKVNKEKAEGLKSRQKEKNW